MNVLKIIGREKALFHQDIQRFDKDISGQVRSSSFLVIGGAGSIGKSVTIEIFKRNPRTLHVVDISENNLVELVRELRSTVGYNDAEFKTFAIDCGSLEFDAFAAQQVQYDYVLNLSAIKHVRSEKDPFTLMRMVRTNILYTLSTLRTARELKAKKYFCVSTDKAANPVNMMGASKSIMELFLQNESNHIPVSTARFANVAFSDGSLLHGFNQRFIRRQPISAPNDVQRYFISFQEAGELCLLSCLLGNNQEIFYPKQSVDLKLTKFSDLAKRYLDAQGFKVNECSSEEEARLLAPELIKKREWPVYFFKSDTTGEKDFEEFFTDHEITDESRFSGVGVLHGQREYDENKLNFFLKKIENLCQRGHWQKSEIVELFNYMLPDFCHKETGRYLDERM